MMDITRSKPETISDLEQEALSGCCDPQAAELLVRQGRLLRLAAQLKALTRTFCAFATDGRSVVNKYVMSGLEVTDEVFESKASVDPLENHLHSLKAGIETTLSSSVADDDLV